MRQLVTLKLLLLVTIGVVLAGVVPYVPNVLDPPVPDQSIKNITVPCTKINLILGAIYLLSEFFRFFSYIFLFFNSKYFFSYIVNYSENDSRGLRSASGQRTGSGGDPWPFPGRHGIDQWSVQLLEGWPTLGRVSWKALGQQYSSICH